MKHTFKSLASVVLILAANIANAQPQLSKDNIDEVIKAMTIEEKVDMIIGCGMSMNGADKFPGTAGRTRDIPRLGIRSIYMADGPHGVRMAQTREWDSNFYYCTEFPSSMTVAASFDPELAYQIGKAIGEEVKDYGLDVILAPGVNLFRNALCGRNHEYYCEDPVLAGKMAASYINGVQSEGTGACIKHFAVNGQETNRNNMDSRVNQRPLRELYLRNFEIAIKESQPWSVMTAYNKVNGKYTCEDKDLTETILRDEWGFKGMVMSDWNAGKDAVASMKAGNDMLQPGQPRQRQAILDAAKDGSLPMEIIDRNVHRILEFVVKGHSFNNYQYPNETDLKAHAKLVREKGAEGMVLLKNQDNVLPLNIKNVAMYGCTSYDIVSGGMGFGGTGKGYYCVSLVEGMRKAGYNLDASLIDLYKKHIAAENKRLYPNGLPPFSLTALKRAEEPVHEAGELSKQVAANDVAIISIARTSGEGADRRIEDFNLRDSEKALLKQVSDAYHAEGKKVVVLLNICGAMETASWKDMVDGIVCTFQPGEQVGNSIADVLSGKVNPCGKLPMTFQVEYGDAPSDKDFPYDYEFKMPDFAMGTGMNIQKKKEEEKPKAEVRNVDYTLLTEGIYIGYRYFDTYGKKVSYPFGYGLSYTTFAYETVSSAINGDKCEMKVKVTNTGKVAGRESVQLYVKAPKGKLDKPAKELKAFGKTSVLQPGQSEVVTLTWNTIDMASFNEKASAWQLDKGEYEFLAAASSAEVKCSAKQKVGKAQSVKVNNVMAPQQTIGANILVTKR